jgi:hypothetical protein
MIVSIGHINQESACNTQYQKSHQQYDSPYVEAPQASSVPVGPLVTTSAQTRPVSTVSPTALPVTAYPIFSTSLPTPPEIVPRKTLKQSKEVLTTPPTGDEYLRNKQESGDGLIHDWSIYDKNNENPRPTKAPVYYSSGGGQLDGGGGNDNGFVSSKSINFKQSSSDDSSGLTRLGMIGVITALILVVLVVMLSLRRRGYKRKNLCEFTSILYSDINIQNHYHDEDPAPKRHDQLIMENSDNSNGTIGRFRLPVHAILSESSGGGRNKKSPWKHETGSLNSSTTGNLLMVDDVDFGSIMGFDNEEDDHECSTNDQTPIVNKTKRNNISLDDLITTKWKKTNKNESTTPLPGAKETSPSSVTGGMAKAAFAKLFGEDVRRQNSTTIVNSPAVMYTTPCEIIGTTPPSSEDLYQETSSHSRSSLVLVATIKAMFVGDGSK